MLFHLVSFGARSNGKTPKSSRGTRAWISNEKNTEADVDKAIMRTANSIAEHLKKTNWSQRKQQTEEPEDEDSLIFPKGAMDTLTTHGVNREENPQTSRAYF